MSNLKIYQTCGKCIKNKISAFLIYTVFIRNDNLERIISYKKQYTQFKSSLQLFKAIKFMQDFSLHIFWPFCSLCSVWDITVRLRISKDIASASVLRLPIFSANSNGMTPNWRILSRPPLYRPLSAGSRTMNIKPSPRCKRIAMFND